MKALYSGANVQDSGTQRPKLSSLSGRGNYRSVPLRGSHSPHPRLASPSGPHTAPPAASPTSFSWQEQCPTKCLIGAYPHKPLYSLRPGCISPKRRQGWCVCVCIWGQGGQLQDCSGTDEVGHYLTLCSLHVCVFLCVSECVSVGRGVYVIGVLLQGCMIRETHKLFVSV